MRYRLLGAAVMLVTTAAFAQPGTAHIGTGIDRDSAAAIEAQARTLLAQAEKSPSGLATVTLKKYPDHSTMLVVRTKSGGAEMHAGFNDIFFVLDGEATEMTGGTIVDPKEVSPGETRGEKVEGGVSTAMRKGDVIHIDPDIPHQIILAPGATFTYYVIKIAAGKE
jgi:mannose-6-phosphate isomerase-like protein (cupin superfamily)